MDFSNDWTLDASGDLTTLTGVPEVKQRLFIRLGTNQGEWAWDTRVGVPWLFSILSQKGDSAAVRQLVVDQIREDRDVAAVGEMQSTFDNARRKLFYTIAVRLNNGLTTTVAT